MGDEFARALLWIKLVGPSFIPDATGEVTKGSNKETLTGAMSLEALGRVVGSLTLMRSGTRLRSPSSEVERSRRVSRTGKRSILGRDISR
jgi:hypothetical protein